MKEYIRGSQVESQQHFAKIINNNLKIINFIDIFMVLFV